MLGHPRILAFAGSARAASFNRRLVSCAADAARQAGAEVTLVELRDYPMPIYDGDDEARDGIPAKALELRSLFAEHHGFLIASPEYNGSVTALLKNSLDWCSRPVEGSDGLAPFKGKTAALLGASLSPFGGIRSVTHLRGILGKMGCHVLADEVLVPSASTAFDAEGKLANGMAAQLVTQLASGLAQQLRHLSAS